MKELIKENFDFKEYSVEIKVEIGAYSFFAKSIFYTELLHVIQFISKICYNYQKD